MSIAPQEIAKSCSQCGGGFSITPKQMKRIYCSESCSKRAWRATKPASYLRQIEADKLKNAHPAKLLCCLGCGTEFPVSGRACNSGPTGKKWCSGKCRARHRKREERVRDPKRALFNNAKVRAQKKGVPFSITLEDINIPERCPIFNTPITFGNSLAEKDSSPSLDRVVPHLGYVSGNVIVMSTRANILKNDAAVEELERIVEWLKTLPKAS